MIDRATRELLRGETITAEGTNAAVYTVTNDALLLEAVAVRHVASSTVGVRAIVLEVLDAEVVVARLGGDVSQAQSTTRWYTFGHGVGSPGGLVGQSASYPVPLYRLEPGWQLRARDASDVDAAGDAIALTASVRRVRSAVG